MRQNYEVWTSAVYPALSYQARMLQKFDVNINLKAKMHTDATFYPIDVSCEQ